MASLYDCIFLRIFWVVALVLGNFLSLHSWVCGSDTLLFYGLSDLRFYRDLRGGLLSLLNKLVRLKEKGNTIILVLTLSFFLSSKFIIGYVVSQNVRLKIYLSFKNYGDKSCIIKITHVFKKIDKTEISRNREGCSMKNIEMTVEDNILTLKVDLNKEFGPSSSGKNIIIASTEGNITVPDREEKIGLNIYRKKKPGEGE